MRSTIERPAFQTFDDFIWFRKPNEAIALSVLRDLFYFQPT